MRWGKPVLAWRPSVYEPTNVEPTHVCCSRRRTSQNLQQSVHALRCVQTTDRYGSPGIMDIQSVAKRVNRQLEDELGEDAAGDIEINISSPVRNASPTPFHCGYPHFALCRPGCSADNSQALT